VVGVLMAATGWGWESVVDTSAVSGSQGAGGSQEVDGSQEMAQFEWLVVNSVKRGWFLRGGLQKFSSVKDSGLVPPGG
jgi:hypothetical protein